MGVSGCGKSAIGAGLAAALEVPYLEGDSYHPPANVAKMASGVPLNDDDRAGWLQALHDEIAVAREHGTGLVLSCSALKRRYRDLLRAADPDLRFAYLAGGRELIASRMRARVDHYMPLSLLDSQLRDLEPLQEDEAGITLDIAAGPVELVAAIVQSASAGAGATAASRG
jgi:gluconokinase